MFQNLSNQLRQNPRLRWGVALIIGTCWLYGVLLLRDALQEETRQHRGATLALARLSGQLTQTEWLARVTPAQTLAVQLEGKLWQAATSGLAQAAFQDMLNGAMANAAVPRPQISVTVVDDMAATPPDLWKVKAKLGFDFTAASLLALLQLLETHPKQIVVGSLGVNKDQPNRVDLELYAYFQKPTQPLAPL
jgi:hypothetical protein